MRKNKFSTLIVILLIVINIVERTKAQCDWKCDNGECLDSDNLCDGEVDCRDGSDETADNCIHVTCPKFSFRCTYGACVAASEKCNGIKKCADNSDENAFMCNPDKTSLNNKLQGSCGSSGMECEPGKCIEMENMCDGILHCQNGYDETVEVCSALQCPSYAFRCGYGGCVNGDAKCNGTLECADGSDEATVLCGRPKPIGGSSPRPPLPPPPTKPKPTPTISTDGGGGSCRIPSVRNNLIIKHENTGTFKQPGDMIPSSGFVSFKCNAGNTLVGVTKTVCTSIGWNDDIPKCIKYCDPTILEAGVSTIATCTYKGRQVSCTNILPGTEAQINCASGFFKPYWRTSTYDKLLCEDNAKWNSYNKVPCEMECGIIQPYTTAFIKDGIDVEINETPWHTSIYSQFDERTYKRICGGSIISPHLVLSAAHCFWDIANWIPFDVTLFSVLAGKILADYYSNNDEVQMRNITNIIINDYIGKDNQYHNDLSLLVLSQHFTFTVAIRPICLNFQSNARVYIESNIPGFIVGYGINKQSRKEVLQKLNMNSLSFGDCKNELRSINPDYKLPDDKFCVKNTIGGSSCRGDSGGGFAIRELDNNRETYYRLVGIISHAPAKVQDCSKDGIVALTNLNFFNNEINKHYSNDKNDTFKKNNNL